MKKLLFGLAITGMLAACKGGSMSVSAGTDSTGAKIAKNKQVAMASETAINNHDVDGIYKDVSADFVEYNNGEMKSEKNVDSLKAGFKAFFVGFPDFKGEKLVAVADSNIVIVTGIWTGTFKNEFMKMKPNNKMVSLQDADIFTFNDKGQITSHRNIQSNALIFKQLDISMPAADKNK